MRIQSRLLWLDRLLVPVVADQVVDLYGTVGAGVITAVSATHPQGYALHFSLNELTGAFADLPWTVTDDGLVVTGFNRLDSPGDAYTTLRVTVTDGVSAKAATLTLHWGYSGDYNPGI